MKKILYFLAFILFISCSENAEDLIKNRKDDAIKKFEQFYACYEIAKNTSSITENKINWEDDDCDVEYKTKNIYQISYENFKDLSVPLDIPYDGTRRREHADMAKLFNIDLSKYKEEHSYNIDESYSYHEVEFGESCKYAILNFLNTKYLVINKIIEYTPPIVIDAETYEQGEINMNVLVFDVEKTKLLGGFYFTIGNSEKVYYSEENAYSFDTGEYQLKKSLDNDLNNNVKNYVNNEFKRLTPSIKDSNFIF